MSELTDMMCFDGFDCGDYDLAIKGLELNGYKLIYSIKEVKEHES